MAARAGQEGLAVLTAQGREGQWGQTPTAEPLGMHLSFHHASSVIKPAWESQENVGL